MRERPILFSGLMVHAILEGSKTQTRRIAKPVKHPDLGNVYVPGALMLEREPKHVIERACPYGIPGDRLWVRETWQHSNHPFGPYEPDCLSFYRADYLDDPLGPDLERSADGIRRQWRPSIHMPRAASRILLEVTGVRVERLQDISEDDVTAEGVSIDERHGIGYCIGADRPPSIRAYRELWEQLNGAGSWNANPWVWVIEFRRIS